MNGSFLLSRGAVMPALQITGLTPQECRRAWQALRSGVWNIDEMLGQWLTYVSQEGKWEAHEYEGYQPLVVDWTAIWRVKLNHWLGKMYRGLTGRAEKGIGFGLVCRVGQIGQQRVPLLLKIIRMNKDEANEANLKKKSLTWCANHLKENEVLVVDAGVEIGDMQSAGIARYVIRLAANCTARRDFLPPRKKQGRPRKKGNLVRPLARRYRDRELPSTLPDEIWHFVWSGRDIVVHSWVDVVPANCHVGTADPYHIWLFHDPLYDRPLILGTNLTAVMPMTLFALYLDRWPVEQIPLVSKQLLGLHRQFVWQWTSCCRLSELGFLLGNVLTYLAATLPPMPTGFWDRKPRKTPGRLSRVLFRAPFPKNTLTDPQICKKRSVTAHLPKGIDAHRRQPRLT